MRIKQGISERKVGRKSVEILSPLIHHFCHGCCDPEPINGELDSVVLRRIEVKRYPTNGCCGFLCIYTCTRCGSLSKIYTSHGTKHIS